MEEAAAVGIDDEGRKKGGSSEARERQRPRQRGVVSCLLSPLSSIRFPGHCCCEGGGRETVIPGKRSINCIHILTRINTQKNRFLYETGQHYN
jgi:hypothetical protein